MIGKIIGWALFAFGAITMLIIFGMIGAMVVMRIRDNWNQLNSAQKLLKFTGKVVGGYMLYVAMSSVVLFVLWLIICYPPYPYNGFLCCFIIGFLAGMIYTVGKK